DAIANTVKPATGTNVLSPLRTKVVFCFTTLVSTIKTVNHALFSRSQTLALLSSRKDESNSDENSGWRP
ncbi:hypothetical protein, partial [Proteus mirabilis]|uniref:hypothetical protein n=1 Tax=Proteus mirabilis TaxID=584 RepID=UPI0014308F45